MVRRVKRPVLGITEEEVLAVALPVGWYACSPRTVWSQLRSALGSSSRGSVSRIESPSLSPLESRKPGTAEA